MRPVAVLLAVTAALATGCSSGHGAASGHPATSTAAAAGRTPRCPAGWVNTGHFLISTTVDITDHGFSPVILVTGMGETVVWRNHTSRTQSVYFDQWGGSHPSSGPIPPGGTWRWKASRTGSALYHSTFAPTRCGQVQVQLIGNQ